MLDYFSAKDSKLQTLCYEGYFTKRHKVFRENSYNEICIPNKIAFQKTAELLKENSCGCPDFINIQKKILDEHAQRKTRYKEILEGSESNEIKDALTEIKNLFTIDDTLLILIANLLYQNEHRVLAWDILNSRRLDGYVLNILKNLSQSSNAEDLQFAEEKYRNLERLLSRR